jgi:hypothetical protein
MDQVVHVELTTGERMALASDVAAWRATETHLLWRNATTDDEPAQIVLLDVTTGTQHMLDLQASTDGSFAWQFEPGGEFVIHERRDVAVIEAFDLRGQPVPLPALGVLLSVFPGGGVLTRDADGQLFHTELRAQASVALDHRIDPMPPKPGPQFFRSPVASDRIEVLRGDDLWAVPLDGAEASLLARDVALPITWIDEGHLLTLFDGVLQTISVPGGERRVHARDVAAVTTAGKLSVDGAHYLREDGVWYLPPSALRGAPAPD